MGNAWRPSLILTDVNAWFLGPDREGGAMEIVAWEAWVRSTWLHKFVQSI